MKKVMVGVAVALCFATSNAAADGVDKRPPPTIAAPQPIYAPTWSGFYIGAGVGGGAFVHDFSVDAKGFNIVNFDGLGGEGVFGTVIVGWDWQIGTSTVVGVFVDYDFSDISHDFSALDGFVRANIDHNNAWSVGARIGLLASPTALWYATAGYTEAEFEASARLDGIGSIFSRDRTFSGWFVGGGIDSRLAASNWFLRLEYRFTEFDSERLFHDGPIRIETEPSMHTARLTLTYKFGGAGYGWNGWKGW